MFIDASADSTCASMRTFVFILFIYYAFDVSISLLSSTIYIHLVTLFVYEISDDYNPQSIRYVWPRQNVR